jgi:phenylpropionate dioxygenase-like ring-hydroxylating dioxygenase large terminal subunit
MKSRPVNTEKVPRNPLAAWTYLNPELYELEYEAFFLARWQFVGHVNQLAEPGDYLTVDLGRDNVIVIRNKDMTLRGFLNVCRHRGSRLLDGQGSCQGVIKCPYHGWTYTFDGRLLGVPKEYDFPEIEREENGLHEVEVEEFHGLVFVRIRPGRHTVAEMFGDTSRYLEMYDVANYVPCFPESRQEWQANWKVAWDNYLENYHIPVGHPGLNRLLDVEDEGVELTSGVSYGVFTVKDKPSKIDIERRYQELFHHANERVPDAIKGKWVQFGIHGNIGIDLYPEMLDIFQLIPMSPDTTVVRATFFGHPNPTAEEQELRRLNVEINNEVNDEDRELCERVQLGLQSTGYEPGPFSEEEQGLYNFHQMVRERIPVAGLAESPAIGCLLDENERLGG